MAHSVRVREDESLRYLRYRRKKAGVGGTGRYYVSSCQSGKVCYGSKKEARAYARRDQALDSTGLGPMHPYRCPTCDHWHIGHRR